MYELWINVRLQLGGSKKDSRGPPQGGLLLGVLPVLSQPERCNLVHGSINDDIIRFLQDGQFDALIGRAEDAFLEFKGSPYQLAVNEQRQELAKDVSALANANGGIILIGFRTAMPYIQRDPDGSRITKESLLGQP